MKKTLFILLLVFLLLLTSCSWLKSEEAPSSELPNNFSSSASASFHQSEVSGNETGLSQSIAATAVPLNGSWELIKEHEGSSYYFRFVFEQNGNVTYGAGWYLSEFAEIYVGTYNYDGKVLEFKAKPTLYPEKDPGLHCVLNLEQESESTLKTSYNSRDKMYFFQTDSIDIWNIML